MKTKLNIAAALSHDAELLLLDEPTSGLDPVVRDEVLDLLYDFMQDENHAILLSSHITSDLDKIADEITSSTRRGAAERAARRAARHLRYTALHRRSAERP